MKESLLWKQALLRLRMASEKNAQISEIQHCGKFQLSSPAMLKSYHDTLLFILVNAFDEKSYTLAELELKRLVTILHRRQASRRWQDILSNSGLPYSEMRCQYSASLIKWLLKTFPNHVVPVDADLNVDIFRQLSQSALPGIEFYHTTQGRYNTWNRIKWLSGHFKNSAALQWLFDLIDQQDWTPVLKDQLYDRLNIFISWKLIDDRAGITFTRWPVKSVFFKSQPKLITESLSILKTSVTDPLSVSKTEKENLIVIIRSS